MTYCWVSKFGAKQVIWHECYDFGVVAINLARVEQLQVSDLNRLPSQQLRWYVNWKVMKKGCLVLQLERDERKI